jgi:predicted nucleotidyltransferase
MGAGWLLTGGRAKLLRQFLQDPSKEIHVRELSRRSGVSYERAHAYLGELEKTRILYSRVQGNLKLYRPNMSNDLTLKLFESLEVQRREDFLIRHADVAPLLRRFKEELLAAAGDKTLTVLLFGSVARGKYGKDSDLDILVVVPNLLPQERKQVEEETLRVSERIGSAYGQEIVPIVLPLSEFREGLRTKRSFYRELWTDRIVIFGESRFFMEIATEGVPVAS